MFVYQNREPQFISDDPDPLEYHFSRSGFTRSLRTWLENMINYNIRTYISVTNLIDLMGMMLAAKEEKIQRIFFVFFFIYFIVVSIFNVFYVQKLHFVFVARIIDIYMSRQLFFLQKLFKHTAQIILFICFIFK